MNFKINDFSIGDSVYLTYGKDLSRAQNDNLKVGEKYVIEDIHFLSGTIKLEGQTWPLHFTRFSPDPKLNDFHIETGDKVICVSAEIGSRLIKGGEYTVRRITKKMLGSLFLEEMLNVEYHRWRFAPVHSGHVENGVNGKVLKQKFDVSLLKSQPKESYDFVNPSHYNQFAPIEVFEQMIAIWGKEAFMLHCQMTAYKYRMRAGLKPNQPIETDLKKAAWYEEKAELMRKLLEDGDTYFKTES